LKYSIAEHGVVEGEIDVTRDRVNGQQMIEAVQELRKLIGHRMSCCLFSDHPKRSSKCRPFSVPISENGQPIIGEVLPLL
jgi:hypothetical protein